MASEHLKVQVSGRSIIVSKPDTDFSVTYQKQFGNPSLILTRSWIGPHITSPTIAEFRAQAFQAAIDKARELGWMV